MSGGAVLSFSRQKEVVVLSSTEAEYIALCSGVKAWIRRFVMGLGIVTIVDRQTKVLVDNQGEIDFGVKLLR